MRKIRYYILQQQGWIGLCKYEPKTFSDSEECVLFHRHGSRSWYKKTRRRRLVYYLFNRKTNTKILL